MTEKIAEEVPQAQRLRFSSYPLNLSEVIALLQKQIRHI